MCMHSITNYLSASKYYDAFNNQYLFSYAANGSILEDECVFFLLTPNLHQKWQLMDDL